MKRILGLVLLLVLPFAAAADIVGTTRVIDGDTLAVNGQRIRLHGIDAPEAQQLCRLDGKSWQCGRRATRALSGKIDNRSVRCQKRDQDRYGRIVASCMVAADDLGGWMVLQGWAVAYVYYSHEYMGAERLARADRRGVWAGEFVRPWKWRRGERLLVESAY
jgi:endonuclease YncB( thermonuclease family)